MQWNEFIYYSLKYHIIFHEFCKMQNGTFHILSIICKAIVLIPESASWQVGLMRWWGSKNPCFPLSRSSKVKEYLMPRSYAQSSDPPGAKSRRKCQKQVLVKAVILSFPSVFFPCQWPVHKYISFLLQYVILTDCLGTRTNQVEFLRCRPDRISCFLCHS